MVLRLTKTCHGAFSLPVYAYLKRGLMVNCLNLYNLCFITLIFFPHLCSLWGGSVLNLGTKKHKDKYFDGIDNMDYPGCFAMTELHHGELFLLLPVVYLFGCFCPS